MSRPNQRIVVAMMDGMGLGYFRSGALPELEKMAREGMYKEVQGMFPSVTNANNVSIATGAWPVDHGISANSRFDRESGTAAYLNHGVLCDSLFSRARDAGVKSALLTSKRKTKELFESHATLALAAEALTPEQEQRFGKAPEIYTREINYWLWSTALKLLDEEKDLGVIYVHITDYPMHAWPPEAPESMEHLKTIDNHLGRLRKDHPDVALFVTADHGMNFKTRCWDLTRVLDARGRPVQFVLSPERDYYIKHHRNFTGCAWVWLKDEADRESVRGILEALEGVEGVEDSSLVAEKYHLDPQALGDLVVFGDKDTMFGDMETEYENLPSEYRAHGSRHEMDLPLVIWNWKGEDLDLRTFRYNKDLTAFLFR